MVESGSGREVILHLWRVDPLGLPHLIEVLRNIQRNTAAQVPDVLGDIDVTYVVTAYCVQRADLIGYDRFLSVWKETQPAASVQRVIGHWKNVLTEIDLDTMSILRTLERWLPHDIWLTTPGRLSAALRGPNTKVSRGACE